MTADVPETLVERAARAAHAYNNSGVDVKTSPLSWESDLPPLRKWHLAMARASLTALHSEGLIYWAEELEPLQVHLADALSALRQHGGQRAQDCSDCQQLRRDASRYRLRRDTP